MTIMIELPVMKNLIRVMSETLDNTGIFFNEIMIDEVKFPYILPYTPLDKRKKEMIENAISLYAFHGDV
jgi:hypothetical protein